MASLTKDRRRPGRWVIGFALAVTGCVHPAGPRLGTLPAGSTYVAMGSSYAAGPGITVPADSPPDRCQRSYDNYAHQFARKRGLRLIDVSCGGATTAHILGRWGELPPQIDAVTPGTKLVTVTIGGNDVGFSGGLMAASCASDAEPASSGRDAMCEGMKAYAQRMGRAPGATQPDEAAWTKLQGALDSLAQEVLRRAPHARLVFVDYIQIVPPTGSCMVVPLSGGAAALGRAKASRLAQLTAAVARRAGAGLIKASELSRGHDACAADSWATGFIGPVSTSNFTPYHPKLAAMTAIAEALDRQLHD